MNTADDRGDFALALDLADRIEIAEIENGARPAPEIAAHILREIVRRYPTGTRLEAAIEATIALAWRARHELQLIRENRID